MKKTLHFILAFFVVSHCLAQPKPLYKLRDRLMKGDREALEKLAIYLDSPKVITEFLGYHQLQHPEHLIARRILKENCLFSNAEICFESSLTRASFMKFLDSNSADIIFDDTTGEFLITRLAARSTKYELRLLSEEDRKQIDSTLLYSAYPDWVYENSIPKLIADRNPLALLRIASAFYKTRGRFNGYYFNDEEFLDLMKRLTHEEVGVPDTKGNMTFLYKTDFEGVARLNYLIYWDNHYLDYQWDDQRKIFVNTKTTVRAETTIERLFGLLRSDNDSIAKEAYIRLAEEDTSSLNPVLRDYHSNMIYMNRSLPTFPYNFLNGLSLLIRYCRSSHIDYIPSGNLDIRLKKLLDPSMHFSERYRYENTLIDSLSFNEITQLEYFGLINEQNWSSTYSIGRIIDKFYSRNWTALIQNQQALELYLKKSRIFDDLGIIGTCNKYLKKFENASRDVLQLLQDLADRSADEDIRKQAKKVIDSYRTPFIISYRDKKIDESNADVHTRISKNKFTRILNFPKNKDDHYWAINKLVGKINYRQIGELLQLLDEDSTLNKRCYNFLERDFGFPIDDNDTLGWRTFKKDYADLNEYQLYEKYLSKINPTYSFPKETPDYNKIYDILKYDVVDAFVGGGGSRREDGIYLLIKLLELRFHTTLGFPRKLCNSMGIYGCDCTDRAKYWMRFLVDKGLVTPDSNEPVSISHNY